MANLQNVCEKKRIHYCIDNIPQVEYDEVEENGKSIKKDREGKIC